MPSSICFHHRLRGDVMKSCRPFTSFYSSPDSLSLRQSFLYTHSLHSCSFISLSTFSYLSFPVIHLNTPPLVALMSFSPPPLSLHLSPTSL